jgi:hypothetical protein
MRSYELKALLETQEMKHAPVHLYCKGQRIAGVDTVIGDKYWPRDAHMGGRFVKGQKAWSLELQRQKQMGRHREGSEALDYSEEQLEESDARYFILRET